MSTYRLPPVLYDESGNLAGPIPLRSGVGVSATAGATLFEESGGRLWLYFPVETEWIAGNGLVSEQMPWPGWREVDVHASDAVREFQSVTDAASALHFARRYGPLWACPSHSFRSVNPDAPGLQSMLCLWSGAHIPDVKGNRCIWNGYEPLDWWLLVARALRTSLNIAARLRDEKGATAGQWEALGYPKSVGAEKFSLPGQASLLVLMVNSWIAGCHVDICLDSSLTLVLEGGPGFLPYIWPQAAAMIAGGRALALCSSCGVIYARSGRAAKRGQRNYCPACGPHARKRLWKRASHASGGVK